jgi:hypothetical protein
VGRWWNRLVLAALLSSGAIASSHAEGPGDGWGGGTTEDGAAVFLSQDDLATFAKQYLSPSKDGPWYDFASVSVCGGHPERPGSDNLCLRAVVLCQGNDPSQGLGPAVAVFRRQLDRAGKPSPGPAGRWEQAGITCFPDLVPGAGRGLTMAMIRDAFHDTDFSVPTVNIQPENDVTLVNLPTFFELRFPEAGFGPDEVDTPDPARLLGYRIEVRPRLKSVTYHLGTTTIGPTTSLGGPHPTGDIRATYTQPGKHQVRADIVYTGQFRVSGSQWFDIPGDVNLRGTPVTLTVREATARLYTH